MRGQAILDLFSKDRRSALNQYRSFMGLVDEHDYDEDQFVGEEYSYLIDQPQNIVHHRKKLDAVLADTGVSVEEFEMIKTGSRQRSLENYKIQYANEAARLKYTLKEIGQNISVSDVSIFHLLHQRNQNKSDIIKS